MSKPYFYEGFLTKTEEFPRQQSFRMICTRVIFTILTSIYSHKFFFNAPAYPPDFAIST